VFNTWLHSPQRTIGLFPDWFGDPQPDWPVQSRLAGFVLSDAPVGPALTDRESPARTRPTGEEGHESLGAFIAGGPPPVVFTAGSANRQARRFFSTAIEASGRIGRRAVLVTGYGEHLPSTLPGHVHHARYVPFTALFPRAAAVVHHGGVGTCAQGFAAGVPQLVMPMGFDQPDNAWRVAGLGAGETIAPSAFTPRRVSKALDRLLSSGRVLRACREWQLRIRAADPVKHACDLLEEIYDRRRADGR
jgi:UDP:flavonoid glycosyltransferase YjiC (YdhE family)